MNQYSWRTSGSLLFLSVAHLMTQEGTPGMESIVLSSVWRHFHANAFALRIGTPWSANISLKHTQNKRYFFIRKVFLEPDWLKYGNVTKCGYHRKDYHISFNDNCISQKVARMIDNRQIICFLVGLKTTDVLVMAWELEVYFCGPSCHLK